MPTLTPTEIYNVCVSVGFTPDQAVTWTAIAMAESGGNTEAHNPHGEDSRGLWQINIAPGVRDNPWGDLNDPYANARAAYEISHGGTDMRPWTTTHASNAGTPHDYRMFMADAQAAAGGAYHGDFSGVSGYDDPHPMGGDEPGVPPRAAAVATAPPPEPDLDRDGAPDAFEMSRGTNPQDPDTDHDGLTDGFELAHGIDATVVDTDHDGLSDAYEVQIGTNPLSADTDSDGVGDAEEVALGRDAVHGIANPDDPAVAAAAELDSDQDGLSDALEAALGTNANLADTDGDHIGDAQEYAQGSDPLHADTDGDGILDDVDIDDHTAIGGLATIGGPGVGVGGPGLGGASPLVVGVAGAPVISPLAAPEAAPPGAPDPGGHTTVAQQFLDAALAQTGDSYVFGAEAQPDDPNPTTFDCSELTQWAASRVGVHLPDGSWQQYLQLKEAGAVIPVDQAVHTPGALLFSFDSEPTPGGGRPGQAHVAISLGDGNTIEARGRAYGVGSWDAGDRFTYAAIIPGLGDAPDFDGDGNPDPVAVVTAPPPEPVVDTDGDGAPDPYEMANGTNPQAADSDGDGLTDGFEMAHGTNPLAMDSDVDGLSDAFEVQAGLNALDPDADHDGFTDSYELAHLAAGGHDPIAVGMAGVGQGAIGLDSDHDGLSDAWESSLGTNPLHEDTDGDQISDAMEEAQGTDPLVPDHHDDNDFDAPEP